MSATVRVTDDLGSAAGPLLAAAIATATARSGRCRIGLSGGSTPQGTFAWLREHLPPSVYPSLWVTWVDERMTADPEARNDALARRCWLDDAPEVGGLLSMVHTGDVDADRAAFAERFSAELGGLDVVLLGAGPDGHIASLFPGHPALASTEAVVAITDSPKPPPTRLSLTLPVLEAVDCAVLLARGASKADVLRRAYEGDHDLPLGRYDPRGDYHWILDPAAAAQVPATGVRT